MKPLKSVNSTSSVKRDRDNLVPLLAKNKLAPSKGYETLLYDWLSRSRSPHTKRMYRSNINAFFLAIGYEIAPDILAQFLLLDSHQAFELVSQYHGSLVERSLAPATINQKLAAIKSLVNYASQAGKSHYTLVNIKAEKLTQYRDTKGIPKSEFKLMVDAVDTDTIKGLRDRAILFLLWGNALRRSEIANCDVKDFFPKARELIIIGKGQIGQPETISLGKSAITAIDKWLVAKKNYTLDDPCLETVAHGENSQDLTVPLFCAVHKGYWGNRLHTHSIYKLVQKYAKLGGIDKVMSPHRIRHSSITEALNLTNGDVRKVQKLSRHSNLNTLMIYDDNRQNLQGEVTGLLDDLI